MVVFDTGAKKKRFPIEFFLGFSFLLTVCAIESPVDNDGVTTWMMMVCVYYFYILYAIGNTTNEISFILFYFVFFFFFALDLLLALLFYLKSQNILVNFLRWCFRSHIFPMFTVLVCVCVFSVSRFNEKTIKFLFIHPSLSSYSCFFLQSLLLLHFVIRFFLCAWFLFEFDLKRKLNTNKIQ